MLGETFREIFFLLWVKWLLLQHRKSMFLLSALLSLFLARHTTGAEFLDFHFRSQILCEDSSFMQLYVALLPHNFARSIANTNANPIKNEMHTSILTCYKTQRGPHIAEMKGNHPYRAACVQLSVHLRADVASPLFCLSSIFSPV